jgi:hypothetical protein
VEVQFHAFLSLALDGGERLALCTGCFIPGEITSSTHWIGGLVGPRAGLEVVSKRKISVPAGN